ncbi:hypothetical protein N9B82_00575 [Saprospiraceae bacterium]|nr:hypothetical protein [Saprospiraceae bacterium]
MLFRIRILVILFSTCVINLTASPSDFSISFTDTIPDGPEELFSSLETSFDFDLDTSDIVGTVKTFNRVKLYSGNVDSITIIRTDVYITEGLYKNLRFYTDDGRIFENTRFVSVSSFRHQRDDVIKNINFNQKGEYIILGECMDYLWVNGNNFAPSDNSFFLDSENPKKAINVNAGLNSFIELKTYSDLLALINTEENGLVQVEASSRIIGYTRNISKNGNIYFLNYIEPSIRYSKFDNDFEFITVDSVENDLLVINRSQLNQIAKLEFELLINSFRFYTKAGHYIDINGLISYKYSDIKYRDSINTANLVSFGLNFAYDLPRYKNFGMEMNLTTEMQYIARNSGFNPNQVSGLFNQPEWVFFWSPELTLYYSPLENRENKIYLKVSGVNSLLESDKNFSQVQLGYRTRIKLN